MHVDKVRHSGPLSLLSQVSRTVRSLQTPCQRAAQAQGQAAWRQRLQCTPPYTAERHAGWTTEQLAQDHGDGSSLGAMQGGEWHKDRQRELMQCLEYQIHWQVLLQTVRASLTVRRVKIHPGTFWGLQIFRNVVSCELGRSCTPVCTGSV